MGIVLINSLFVFGMGAVLWITSKALNRCADKVTSKKGVTD